MYITINHNLGSINDWLTYPLSLYYVRMIIMLIISNMAAPMLCESMSMQLNLRQPIVFFEVFR